MPDGAPSSRHDLAAALLAALDAGCPIALAPTTQGNPVAGEQAKVNQAVPAPVAQVAPIALPTDQVGAESDEAAERAAIMAEPALPKPGTRARVLLDERQAAQVAGLMVAARLRPPFRAEPAAVPIPGACCSRCGANRFCNKLAEPSGWHCATCHLTAEAVGRAGSSSRERG